MDNISVPKQNYRSGAIGTFLSLVVLLGVVISFNPGLAQTKQININGAGATFPQPLYSRWASEYMGISGDVITYQGVGSGAGIAQIKAGAVDFGASDEPLEYDQLQEHGLVQFPLVMGAVVPVFNLEGIGKGKLRITPDLLADIFLGKIKMWNDRRIMAVNQDLRLPEIEITVAHRADGSGTTWILTKYLSKVSNEWQSKIGNDKSVSWVTGVGARGNQRMAELVKKTPGSIGYVEYAYAFREKLSCAQLQNQSGRFVTPNMDSFKAAAINAVWEENLGFATDLTDQPGEKSWPIMGASYILIAKNQADPNKASAMLKFFDWSFRRGRDTAVELHYVPIPQAVYQRVLSMWSKEILFEEKPLRGTRSRTD